MRRASSSTASWTCCRSAAPRSAGSLCSPAGAGRNHVQPLAGTDLCEAPHFQYHVQGVLHVVMADGSEFDARPGDVTALPEGHDAWVVGDEPVVVVDWYGASNYARS